MTQDSQPGREPFRERKMQSPDRRARLAKALKANIARRKQGARLPAAHAAPEAGTPQDPAVCDTPLGPAETSVESRPANPGRP